MITRDEILAADAEETLIGLIAAVRFDQREALADLLSEMHNSGEIDFFATCKSRQLNTISGHMFFDFQRVFCLALPRIHCQAKAAMTASTQVFRKAGADRSAGLAYEALREWFRQSSERIKEGLAVINRDIDNHIGTVRYLLLAGAEQDAEMFTTEALDLSEQTRSQIRSAALWALGRIVPEDNHHLLHRALSRFKEVVDGSHSDQDMAAAVEAALHLLHRTHGSNVDAVRSLLERACGNPSALLRHALGRGLQNYRSAYDETMIDMTLSALQNTRKKEVNTIQAINSFLYDWDIDGDRDRVFRFLSKLLGGRDDAIKIDALDNFQHRIRNERGKVLGWYAVSWLLTGDEKLCSVAYQILPYNQKINDLDIDLGSFALDPPWVAFLTRKILGYCLVKKESVAALLLSCLRAAPEASRAEIEDLIYDHFLMNYLTVIKWFENAVSKDDPARNSVNRLSLKLKSYVDALRECGTCPAFRPTEREQQLQGYRLADFWRDTQKQTEKSSALFNLVHKANILYGSASILYRYTDDSATPHRQEISMASHEHFVEFPRPDAIDRVGLSHTIRRFRLEAPPT